MLVLDTNHFSEFEMASRAGSNLRSRLDSSPEDAALAIVAVEEGLRGWLAEIHRTKDPDGMIFPYAKLQRQVESFGNWIILGWDGEAAGLFRGFRKTGVRIGTMDLKIACICLAHDATLLTRNVRDFAQVPGLRFENWLD